MMGGTTTTKDTKESKKENQQSSSPATQANTRRITEFLHEKYPDVEVETHPGGQPLYPYLFGIE